MDVDVVVGAPALLLLARLHLVALQRLALLQQVPVHLHTTHIAPHIAVPTGRQKRRVKKDQTNASHQYTAP